MQMHRGTARTRRGFTLLELLIAVTLIAILSGMAITRTGRLLTGWRMQRAAEAMSDQLQQGFALVGRNRRPVIMQFRKDSMTLYMKGRSGTVFNRRHFGRWSEYKLDSTNVTFSNYALEVYPPGLAADSLTIDIRKDGMTKRIRMLRGGLVRICKSLEANKC